MLMKPGSPSRPVRPGVYSLYSSSPFAGSPSLLYGCCEAGAEPLCSSAGRSARSLPSTLSTLCHPPPCAASRSRRRLPGLPARAASSFRDLLPPSQAGSQSGFGPLDAAAFGALSALLLGTSCSFGEMGYPPVRSRLMTSSSWAQFWLMSASGSGDPSAPGVRVLFVPKPKPGISRKLLPSPGPSAASGWRTRDAGPTHQAGCSMHTVLHAKSFLSRTVVQH